MNARRCQSILRQINRANGHLHQKHMRGAADVAIFEGPECREFLKFISPDMYPPHFLNQYQSKPWIQVILKGYWNDNRQEIQKACFPKSRITVIKYAGFGAFKYHTREEMDTDQKLHPDVIDIPEINLVTQTEPQPDYIELIELDTLLTDDWGLDEDYEKWYQEALEKHTLAS